MVELVEIYEAFLKNCLMAQEPKKNIALMDQSFHVFVSIGFLGIKIERIHCHFQLLSALSIPEIN